MAEAITPRGTELCRLCDGVQLVSVLDLGDQPLANEMGVTAAEVLPAFPLHLRICPDCGLGQVGEYVLPDRIFGAARDRDMLLRLFACCHFACSSAFAERGARISASRSI